MGHLPQVTAERRGEGLPFREILDFEGAGKIPSARLFRDGMVLEQEGRAKLRFAHSLPTRDRQSR